MAPATSFSNIFIFPVASAAAFSTFICLFCSQLGRGPSLMWWCVDCANGVRLQLCAKRKFVNILIGKYSDARKSNILLLQGTCGPDRSWKPYNFHTQSIWKYWRTQSQRWFSAQVEIFILGAAAAVKIWSQGPLCRLMIASPHRRCFPYKPAQTKSSVL